MPKEITNQTASISSPTGVERGCVCADNTYHVDCCNGGLQAQGIGSLVGGHSVVINQVIVNRVINGSHG